MKKQKTIFLLFALLQTIICYSQTNPRLVNENYMQTVFNEDFNGVTLDRGKWYPTEHYYRDQGILVDSPSTISQQNGYLGLRMLYSEDFQDSMWTTNGWIPLVKDYIGAEVNTYDRFQYGSFECRAYYAHANGSWPAFWIIGGDGTPCPPGGYGNEIDIAELLCKDASLTLDHVIHRYYPPEDCNTSNHEQKDKYSYGMSFSGFHIYKCVWTPDKIDYYVDGYPTHQVLNTGQEWYPNLYLRVILSQQVLDPLGAIITPQTSYFDYVRVKQFFLAPEISCPTTICSSGTATLDVDPSASNITWQLSPANLFTTTSGSGTTANISTSNENGTGTVTFSFQMPSGEIFTANKTFWVGLKAAFTGPTSILYEGSGTYTATTSCGASPFIYQWWMREEGTGEEASVIATVNPLVLVSIPRLSKLQMGEKISLDPETKQPYETTYYDLYLRVIDSYNTSYTTSERRIIAYGDVDLVPISQQKKAVEKDAISLYAYPNPASDETTLLLIGKEDQPLDVSNGWEIEVYDAFQMLQTKVQGIQGSQYKVKTYGWKDGVYLVRAKVNDRIISGKFIINQQ